MRRAGWDRLKRSCQRCRGPASEDRVVMRPHRTGDTGQRPESGGTMRTMPELLASMHRHRQAIFALGMIAIVVLLLWTARGALPAFFIGLALAFVLDPAVTRLARIGMPRWAGVVVMYVAVVAVVWALVAFVLPPISRQAREFVEQLPELGASLRDVEAGLEEWYLGLPLPAEIRAMV